MPLTRARREKNRYLNPIPTEIGGLSVMFKVGPRILFGGAARSPKRTPGPFHTERGLYQTSPRSGLRITWFGHASSLVEIDGVTLLIDPVWEERAAPTQWAGPKRFFPPTLALEDLPALGVCDVDLRPPGCEEDWISIAVVLRLLAQGDGKRMADEISAGEGIADAAIEVDGALRVLRGLRMPEDGLLAVGGDGLFH
jgi:hypothetical protein